MVARQDVDDVLLTGCLGHGPLLDVVRQWDLSTRLPPRQPLLVD
jgi:hypothetical protein